MLYYSRSPEDKYAPHDFSKCETCPQHSERCDYILEQEKKHKNRTNHTKRDSLCWCCAYSVPKPEHDYICPWAEHGKPVDGWIAKMHKTAAGELHASVIDCPNFKRYAEWEDNNGTGSNTE